MENNKETLEETAQKIYPDDDYKDELYCDLGKYDREKWLEGAKYQQDRLYTEEDMLTFGKFCHNDAHSINKVTTFEELLKQFKKSKV